VGVHGRRELARDRWRDLAVMQGLERRSELVS
jgi:hypothetical protein